MYPLHRRRVPSKCVTVDSPPSKCTHFTVSPSKCTHFTVSPSKCTHFTNLDGYYRRVYPLHRRRLSSKCVTVEVYPLHRRQVKSHRRSVPTSPSTGDRRQVKSHRRSVPTSPSTGTIVELSPSKCTHFTVDRYYRRTVTVEGSHFTVDRYYRRTVTVEVYPLHRRQVLSSNCNRRSVPTSPSTGTVEVSHRPSVPTSPSTGTVEVHPLHRRKCTHFTVDGYRRKCTHFTVDGYYSRNLTTSTLDGKSHRLSVPTSPSPSKCTQCALPASPSTGAVEVSPSKCTHLPHHRRRVTSTCVTVEVYPLHRNRYLLHRKHFTVIVAAEDEMYTDARKWKIVRTCRA